MEIALFDVVNFLFVALIPILIKLLNDIKNLYMELVKHKEQIKEVGELKEDIKELRGCLFELKKMIFNKK